MFTNSSYRLAPPAHLPVCQSPARHNRSGTSSRIKVRQMGILAKFSIRTILGLIVGVMGLLLVIVSMGTLTDAAKAWREADRLSKLTEVSRSLVKTLLPFRVERGTEITAVLSEAPANSSTLSRIEVNRKGTETAYAESLKLIALISAPDLPATLSRLVSGHEAMLQLRPRIDAAIQKPKSERPPDLENEVPKV